MYSGRKFFSDSFSAELNKESQISSNIELTV
ncbi:hypothetical protein ES703_91350 [subsurface metagenome]